MHIILPQRGWYRPAYADSGGFVTTLALLVQRLSDGFWLDFNDGTFKNTGWVAKTQALTKDAAEKSWSWSAGWRVPEAREVYFAFLKDDAGKLHQAETIYVNGNVIGAVVADAGNLATTFKTDLPGTVDGAYNNMHLKFIDGFAPQIDGKTFGFNGTTKFISVPNGYSGVPTATWTFILINE